MSGLGMQVAARAGRLDSRRSCEGCTASETPKADTWSGTSPRLPQQSRPLVSHLQPGQSGRTRWVSLDWPAQTLYQLLASLHACHSVQQPRTDLECGLGNSWTLT